jgi:hypothetical protein
MAGGNCIRTTSTQSPSIFAYNSPAGGNNILNHPLNTRSLSLGTAQGCGSSLRIATRQADQTADTLDVESINQAVRAKWRPCTREKSPNHLDVRETSLSVVWGLSRTCTRTVKTNKGIRQLPKFPELHENSTVELAGHIKVQTCAGNVIVTRSFAGSRTAQHEDNEDDEDDGDDGENRKKRRAIQ